MNFAGEAQAPKFPETRWGRHNANVQAKKPLATGRKQEVELKSAAQIVRQRMRLDTIKARETSNKIKKASNRKKTAKRIKAKGKRKWMCCWLVLLFVLWVLVANIYIYYGQNQKSLIEIIEQKCFLGWIVRILW